MADVISMQDWQLGQLTERYLNYVAQSAEDPLRADLEFYAANQHCVSDACTNAVRILLDLSSAPLSDALRDGVEAIDDQKLSFKQICADVEALTGEHSPATQLELFTVARMMMRRMTNIVEAFQ